RLPTPIINAPHALRSGPALRGMASYGWMVDGHRYARCSPNYVLRTTPSRTNRFPALRSGHCEECRADSRCRVVSSYTVAFTPNARGLADQLSLCLARVSCIACDPGSGPGCWRGFLPRSPRRADGSRIGSSHRTRGLTIVAEDGRSMA